MQIEVVLQSQFHAALAMLKQTVELCPDDVWTAPTATRPFWHISYHVLFYTHLYLSPTGADFTAWELHRPNYNYLGVTPRSEHRMEEINQPYTRDEILTYLSFCKNEIDTRIQDIDPDAPSGFDWIPFNKLELMLYNLRHLQHHTGELGDRLGQQGISLNWIGQDPKRNNDRSG
ncbi:MAG: DinB family protein [Caldilineaceae bacterium]